VSQAAAAEATAAQQWVMRLLLVLHSFRVFIGRKVQ